MLVWVKLRVLRWRVRKDRYGMVGHRVMRCLEVLGLVFPDK